MIRLHHVSGIREIPYHISTGCIKKNVTLFNFLFLLKMMYVHMRCTYQMKAHVFVHIVCKYGVI